MKILGSRIDYKKCDNFFITSDVNKRDAIRREHLARIENSFNSEFIDKNDEQSCFNFQLDCGVYSKQIAVQYNPYLLNLALIRAAVALGAKIFEHSEVVKSSIFKDNKGDKKIVETAHCKTVSAKKIIICDERLIDKQVIPFEPQFRKNYTMVTSVIEELSQYSHAASVIMCDESDITIRTTFDNRIILSGLTTNFTGTILDNLFENERFNGKKN